MLIAPTIVSYMSDYDITCWTDASLLLCSLKLLLANLLPLSSLPDEQLRLSVQFSPKKVMFRLLLAWNCTYVILVIMDILTILGKRCV